MCLDEQTGRLAWQWQGPAKYVPDTIDGWSIGISCNPRGLGVCSSPIVDGDRVYFVTHCFKIMCLDVKGQPAGPEAGKARVLWTYDMWDQLGVFPCDAANGSPLIDGDLLYVITSNGSITICRPLQGEESQDAGSRCAESHCIGQTHGPSPGHGRHADRAAHVARTVVFALAGQSGRSKLIFFGGGDGLCYAFEALSSVPDQPVKLKTVWSYDCNPPQYNASRNLDWVTHYCLGDKRRPNGRNTKNDGTFVGMSTIIGTPVFYHNRIYVAIGRDPEHGRGHGALHCIDATKTGDITRTGKIWTISAWTERSRRCRLRMACSTSPMSPAVFTAWMPRPGHCHWVHETKSEVWGSTLVADGKVFMPTHKGLFVLAAGKKKRVLGRIDRRRALCAIAGCCQRDSVPSIEGRLDVGRSPRPAIIGNCRRRRRPFGGRDSRAAVNSRWLSAVSAGVAQPAKRAGGWPCSSS